MESQKVKKINLLYLLGYILVPIAVIVLCGWLGYIFCPDGGPMAPVLFMGPTFVSAIWWIFGGSMIYKNKKKAMEKDLDAKGFVRNQTFNGKTCTLIVDEINGQIALIFFWNPFESFILPASRISKTWVDDGAHGKGFMEGSSQVSFLFIVDGVKIRIYTFTSNKRWRMDSDYILTGISKADMMVKVLEAARAKAN